MCLADGKESRVADQLRFSVVIPLYNKEGHIERALESVLLQPAELIDEIIVINDGSTDSGAEVAKKIAKDHKNIKVIDQDNNGVSVARNNGVEVSKNENILFLDADDEWLPGFCTEIVRLIKCYSDCAVFATGYMIGRPSGRPTRLHYRNVPASGDGVIERFFLSASKGRNPLSSSSVCIKKGAFEAVGGFPATVSHGEDKIMWGKLALAYNIAWSAKVCVIYHMGTTTQSSFSWNPDKGKEYLRFLENAKRKLVLSKSLASNDKLVIGDLGKAIIAQNETIFFNCKKKGLLKESLILLGWLMVNGAWARKPYYLFRLLIPSSFLRKIKS